MNGKLDKKVFVLSIAVTLFSLFLIYGKVNKARSHLTFERIEVIDAIRRKNSNESILLYFGSKDCKACSLFAPILKNTAEQYNGTVYYIDMDAEENESAKETFNLYYTPTLLMYKGGNVKRIEGAVSSEQLSKSFEKWSD